MAKIPHEYIKSSLINKINILLFGNYANHIFILKHFQIKYLLFSVETYIKSSK